MDKPVILLALEDTRGAPASETHVLPIFLFIVVKKYVFKN